MKEILLAAIPTVLGIVSTFIAWKFNPRREIYARLDKIYYQLDILYMDRDIALEQNRTDSLTDIVDRINKLHGDKNRLLQRL